MDGGSVTILMRLDKQQSGGVNADEKSPGELHDCTGIILTTQPK